MEPPSSKIVLLGTGTPNADPARSGPAVAIVVNDVPYLIDAGPGVVRQAAAARGAGVTGLAAERLNRVFHGVSEQALLEEVRRLYDGPVVSGQDLDVY